MSDEIKRDRSPACPKMPLEEAVDLVRKLYNKAGKASIKPEVAVGPLGYSGINGASLGTLAAIGQYGLVDRERGGNLSISQLALKLLHPTGKAQEVEARKDAATLPRIFAELLGGGFHHCDLSVLTNHLIHVGFTPDGAKRAAMVFKANVEYANLDNPRIDDTSVSLELAEPTEKGGSWLSQNFADLLKRNQKPELDAAGSNGFATTELPIPLDNGLIARIPYPMSEDTFELLLGTLNLWKKRLVQVELSHKDVLL